jgi:phosphohistidine phosphatase
MRLYFLRHEQAADRHEWKGSDAERPLTEDGMERMKRSATMIAALGFGLDAILSSPLTRARQSASIVAEALDAQNKLLFDDRLGTGFDRDALVQILRDHAGSESLMLVGHEPGLSATISALIGGGRIVCKKGGLVCVKLPEAASLQGELLWLIPPRILALLKKTT